MKKNHLTIKINLIIIASIIAQNIFSQCQISHDENYTDIFANQPNLWGQGFVAECSGDLEYIQFLSITTGTISAGTLRIYSGNDVNGVPIYTQSHPSISVNDALTPVRINITNTLSLVENSQYTFEFTVDNVDLLADYSNGYSGGSAFENGNELPIIDFIFTVSILSTDLSVDDFNTKYIKLFPNPSNDYIEISNIQNTQNYYIINVLGQKLLKGVIHNNNNKIDIQNLKNGLHYLKLENGTVIKFIKK